MKDEVINVVSTRSRSCGIVSDSSSVYCTITVSAVLWFRLPDLAVTVAVYVPAGVRGVVIGDVEPPPHAAMPKNSTAIIGIARVGMRRR